jgi:hypothetical protein
MPKTCGKAVQTTRIKLGKTVGQLSTVLLTPSFTYIATRVKALVSPKVIRTFPQTYSPIKIAVSPLIEHYFYPVSTGPTITNTK